jgi:transcriptional regulator
MYVPVKFQQDDNEAWTLLSAAAAGTFVIQVGGELRSVLAPAAVSDDRATVTLHIAKANPWWRDVQDGTPVLGLFLAASAYVSPTYYPSLAENKNHVPTWNYAMVELRGTVTIHQDSEWLLHQVTQLSNNFEENRMPRWWVDDAPTDYIDKQLKAIVGVEISVTSIEGVAKLSQNRLDEDRQSVQDHLASGTFTEQNTARYM